MYMMNQTYQNRSLQHMNYSMESIKRILKRITYSTKINMEDMRKYI